MPLIVVANRKRNKFQNFVKILPKVEVIITEKELQTVEWDVHKTHMNVMVRCPQTGCLWDQTAVSPSSVTL